jgi:hydroxymethylbilane synthase
MRTLVAGTRGSHLALWQTRHVCSELTPHLGSAAKLVEKIIVTRGDTDLRDKLQGSLEKGFFTEELEAELRNKQIDLAVHSLKDLPTKDAQGLTVGAVLPRENPADWLVVRKEAVDLSRLPNELPLKKGSSVGTSSLRRQSMIARYAPGCTPKPLRGNVPTRVQRVGEGKYDATVMAAAGLKRLNIDLSAFAVFELDARRWPSAPGQGAVAVQCRADDEELRGWLKKLHHEATAFAVVRERSWLAVLEGGCTTPFGCFIEDGSTHMGLDVQGQWRHHVFADASFRDPKAMQAELDRLSQKNFTEEKSHESYRRPLARPV